MTEVGANFSNEIETERPIDWQAELGPEDGKAGAEGGRQGTELRSERRTRTRFAASMGFRHYRHYGTASCPCPCDLEPQFPAQVPSSLLSTPPGLLLFLQVDTFYLSR